MSLHIPILGLKPAGEVLAAFSLILADLDYWGDVAKAGGFFWQVREEWTARRLEMQYYQLTYRHNLESWLFLVTDDTNEVALLLNHPSDERWASEALRECMKERLQVSYYFFEDIIAEMENVTTQLQKQFVVDKRSLRSKLGIILQPSTNTANNTRDYEQFRLRFSSCEEERAKLVERLQECNKRLEQLLTTSSGIFMPRSAGLGRTLPGKTTNSTNNPQATIDSKLLSGDGEPCAVASTSSQPLSQAYTASTSHSMRAIPAQHHLPLLPLSQDYQHSTDVGSSEDGRRNSSFHMRAHPRSRAILLPHYNNSLPHIHVTNVEGMVKEVAGTNEVASSIGESSPLDETPPQQETRHPRYDVSQAIDQRAATISGHGIARTQSGNDETANRRANMLDEEMSKATTE
jgi:hypothetical protein